MTLVEFPSTGSTLVLTTFPLLFLLLNLQCLFAPPKNSLIGRMEMHQFRPLPVNIFKFI